MDWSEVNWGTAELSIIASVFLLLAALELLLPFRKAVQPKPGRWITNLSLFALDTIAVRVALPFAMVGAALVASEHGWGLFNLFDAPNWFSFVAAIVLLDLALYFQHWATHRVPLLWRLHRVHHTDRDFDVTTAARFHPLEIVLSMAWKMSVVVVLGAPAIAVLVFETGFAVCTLFTHANISLPGRIDKALRKLVVTPDMHRIHHSVRMSETNSNYGTFLSAWDRFFGTYVEDSRDSQEAMRIGLEEWQDDRTARFGFSLLLPFDRN